MEKETKAKTIEELTADFENYKKEAETQHAKDISDLKNTYENEIKDIKKEKLAYELSNGIDVQKEPIPEDEKIIGWDDIASKLETI